MTKFRWVQITFLAALGYILLLANSSGRATATNTGNTGAPSENNCGQCHAGGTYGNVTIAVQAFALGTTTPVTAYVPGTSYDMKVTVTTASGTPSGYGFQLTALTVANNTPMAGYSNLASNVKQKAVTIGSYAGRTYLEQNGVTTNNQFTFRWTAPASYSGAIRFYSSGNVVNNNGSDSGDKAGTGTLTLQPALSATNTTTALNCSNVSNGAINVTVIGGVSPFTYLWNDNATTEDRSNLAAGTYSVTITDAASQTFTISNISVTALSSAPTVNVSTSNVSVFGGTNGSAVLSTSLPNGGSITYQTTSTNGYSNNQTTSSNQLSLNSLSAGTYQVVATNNFGCTSNLNFTISQPTALVSNLDVVQPLCFGDFGHVTVSVSGGIPPYTNSWSNFEFGNEQYLTAGSYSVTTTDQGGATIIQNFDLIDPPPFVAGLSGNDINCNGGSTVLVAQLAGGTLPYNSFDPIVVSVPGIYGYTFSDANNCTSTPTVQINALDAFTVVANTYNPSCYGACNGYVQLTINNGVEPFTSTWSNGGDGSNLCAGNYDLQIQDGTGCTQSFNFLIENPDSVYVISNIQEPICNGNLDGNIFVQPYGGIGNYTFVWNGDPLSNLNSIIYLSAGNYYLDLSDGNGCTAHYDYVLNEPSPLSYSIDSFIESGLGVGEVQMSTSGGTPPYFFQWSNGQTGEDPVLPLNSTNYCTITDANGCSITTTNLTTFDAVFEMTESSLLAYPNPANNQLKLVSDKAIEQLLVVSNYGELVAKHQQLGTTCVVETELFSNGIYSLRVYSGGQWSTIKFAVQH